MSEELNPFKIAQAQLDQAAEILGLDPATHALLREPMREFHVTIPVRMDDGTVKVFKGFRVQYNDARGPTKGGLRFHPDETIDTVRALAAWMTVRKRGLPSGSPPPNRAATVISLISLEKIFPLLASAAPFLCLIELHFE